MRHRGRKQKEEGGFGDAEWVAEERAWWEDLRRKTK